ncbi:hypothetical protein [uncultured Winogradskyella sp.]|uniref:hypothetical protein n=1 Tax=uncultured Winogradskyella sp. TaxID=395353 RepID=UPI00351155C4
MKKNTPNDKITRKEALQKMGKYAALTAIGTFVILNPQKSQAQSPTQPPDPGGNPFAGS